ncbi:DUF3043 domain-containing protein [Psychromicrobium xiongbiense]|uniref:DUF3043 domain-containing protein n=1 Tax=Psychromicrobium xiongbiense TaxID=3051184 RepID=UPI0025539E14|nr:DUF3043 domain-containing protein [Psychromicrobium sp. YIM S02556]
MFGLNKGKDRAAAAAQNDVQKAAQASGAADPRAGKGVPTPRRKEQEALRKRPLVPQDRGAAKAADREARREAQMKMRAALDTGDERFLPARDKGPQKRFARNFVDNRLSLGEYVMFIALAIVVLTVMVPLELQSYLFLGFWVIVLIVAFDSWLMSRKMRQRLAAKFGSVEPGVVWYGVMRSLQFRRLRLPKPQVARGEFNDHL